MELRQLRYFVAVAETRNFTRASEQLHIAQPPLSRQIQMLEAELGVKLLVRNSRPVGLTPAGQAFYEQAVQVLARVEQMKATAQHIGANQARRLTIGFVPSALYGGLPLLMRKLRQRFPDVDLQMLEMATSLEQVSSLQSGRIDIGLCRIRSTDDSVARIVLAEEKLVLVVAPSHPLAQHDGPVPLARLAGQRLIVYPRQPRPSFADHVLSLLRDDSIRPKEILEVPELQTALGLVAAESGVCLIPSSARIRSDVVYLAVAEERVTSPIILIHRQGETAWYLEDVLHISREVFAEAPQCCGQGCVP